MLPILPYMQVLHQVTKSLTEQSTKMFLQSSIISALDALLSCSEVQSMHIIQVNVKKNLDALFGTTNQHLTFVNKARIFLYLSICVCMYVLQIMLLLKS